MTFAILTFCYTDGFATTFRAGGLTLDRKVKSLKEIKELGVVKQSLDYSCGAAGLSTILKYHLNDPITEHEIINEILQHVDVNKVKERGGFSLLDLKSYVEAKGYKATGYKMDIKFLAGLDRPILVPIKFKNYKHFVIVKAVIGDRVYITDPAIGNLTMKDVKFEEIWTNGIGLMIEREGTHEDDYQHRVTEQDAIFADYERLYGLIPSTVIRTAVYPTEFHNL